jgi:hypothetical protein
MSPLVGLMHILSADREARDRPRGALDQDCRHAQSDIDLVILPGSFGNRPDLGEIRRQAVHLPIAGDELPERHPLSFLGPLAARLDARQPGP